MYRGSNYAVDGESTGVPASTNPAATEDINSTRREAGLPDLTTTAPDPTVSPSSDPAMTQHPATTAPPTTTQAPASTGTPADPEASVPVRHTTAPTSSAAPQFMVPVGTNAPQATSYPTGRPTSSPEQQMRQCQSGVCKSVNTLLSTLKDDYKMSKKEEDDQHRKRVEAEALVKSEQEALRLAQMLTQDHTRKRDELIASRESSKQKAHEYKMKYEAVHSKYLDSKSRFEKLHCHHATPTAEPRIIFPMPTKTPPM
eukprot:NODE_6418_length_849_cov_2.004132_g6182_i0.p1 GENE.NODE_6418_length_849_cov_2.004132_g6182_i0~~NODE_6418_length_849_cov_2.004132_g6182_i0.p1  ORF type:complete len:256 (-),score=61.18 NODE_6418_length_849_cov_2.004132_g6182_i0:82-849(-)